MVLDAELLEDIADELSALGIDWKVPPTLVLFDPVWEQRFRDRNLVPSLRWFGVPSSLFAWINYQHVIICTPKPNSKNTTKDSGGSNRSN